MTIINSIQKIWVKLLLALASSGVAVLSVYGINWSLAKPYLSYGLIAFGCVVLFVCSVTFVVATIISFITEHTGGEKR